MSSRLCTRSVAPHFSFLLGTAHLVGFYLLFGHFMQSTVNVGQGSHHLEGQDASFVLATRCPETWHWGIWRLKSLKLQFGE
jgi:hypothetical protein